MLRLRLQLQLALALALRRVVPRQSPKTRRYGPLPRRVVVW